MKSTSQLRHLICATFLMFAAGFAIADEKKPVVTDLKAKEIATKIAEDDKIVILDVRTKAEFDEGHLKGAQNIDFLDSEKFAEEIEKLDRDVTYVVHCKVGGRSRQSLELLKSKGFKSILHMSDGYLGWAEAGLDSEK